jgi:hypothetical protein
MSIIDAIFILFYFACGALFAWLLGRHLGPIYGIAGFFLGFLLPMMVWRFLAPRFGKKGVKP